MSKKYDRHIEILNFLVSGKRTTYYLLSREFAVSLKTIKKDIAELSYFFPIDTYRGVGGGVEMHKTAIINGYIMKREYLEILEEALMILQRERDSDDVRRLIAIFHS